MKIIQHIKDRIAGKVPSGAKRSGEWPRVRKEHLDKNPACALCGGGKDLEVHHIHPFHLHPDLELSPANLITLCESKNGGVNCHLFMGHLGNFKSFNVDVVADTSAWDRKILLRPKAD